MKNEIRHLGVVDTVDVGLIKVRITQTSACSSCKMSGNCNASESKEKVVDVYCDNHYGLKTGDNVIVIASQRTGFFCSFVEFCDSFDYTCCCSGHCFCYYTK